MEIARKLFEKYLGMCARRVIEREHPRVIALTGSVGKSTTRQMVAAALDAYESKTDVRAPEKNYNNELGVPLTVFGFSAPGRSLCAWMRLLWFATWHGFGGGRVGCGTYVLEMGADKPGDIASLVRLAPPTIGIVTGITPEDALAAPVHVAQYPSLEALVEEKSTLVKALTPQGIAILNIDDSRVYEMRHLTSAQVITYGKHEKADIRLAHVRIETQRTDVGQKPVGLRLQGYCYGQPFELVLLGVFGRSAAYGACAAVALAHALNIDLKVVLDRLSYNYRPLPGRVRILPGIRNSTLYDDTYNASPASVLAALRDLISTPREAHQRVIACLGEMRELGEIAEAMHRRIGQEAAALGIDLLVACGTFGRAMADAAVASGLAVERVRVFEDTPDAASFLVDEVQSGDIVLVKASQGTLSGVGVRMERVIYRLLAQPQLADGLLVRQEKRWKYK